MTARIDAHQHFWTLRRNDYGWLTPDMDVLYRDYLPHELMPMLVEADVARTILVQAAPTDAETQFLLMLASETPFIAGVVGWTDLAASDAPERIAALACERRLRGVRPMLQDIDDPTWIDRAELTPALAALAEHGLVFDALVRTQHIAPLCNMARRHPSLSIVIDHAAKPVIAGPPDAAWIAGMTACAALPNMAVKMSGLLTQAPSGADADSLRAHVALLIAQFGPARILWGSDWPVLALASDYGRWAAMAEELLEALPEQDRVAIMGGNAARIYGLPL